MNTVLIIRTVGSRTYVRRNSLKHALQVRLQNVVLDGIAAVARIIPLMPVPGVPERKVRDQIVGIDDVVHISVLLHISLGLAMRGRERINEDVPAIADILRHLPQKACHGAALAVPGDKEDRVFRRQRNTVILAQSAVVTA